jgi:hypothetical protein
MLGKKIIPFAAFYIVANPATFKLVRKGLGNWVASVDGVPTQAGLLLHALVYVIVAHLLWKLFMTRKSGFGGQVALNGDCKANGDCMFGGCKSGKCALL